jgi:DNA-binding NarL/FixJ family response regulator
MAPKKINILIADDHKLFRETCCILFERDPRFHIAGQACNGKEAIQQVEDLGPDVILMDINMAPVNGFEAVETILKNKPDSKIIAVSMNSNLHIMKKILHAGALGYVSKNSSVEELTNAVLQVNSGGKYMCNETKELLVNTFVTEEIPPARRLSGRELVVIQYVKEGLSSREIADKLGISAKTVEVHRYNILKKTKLKNSAALVNFSIENGL